MVRTRRLSDAASTGSVPSTPVGASASRWRRPGGDA